MPDTTLDNFLKADTPTRLRMAQDAAHAETLHAYFGDAAFAEYLTLADQLDDEHLSISHAPNLIFVPGVMGSILGSKTLGGIWWIDPRTRAHIDDLRLAPDGKSDFQAGHRVVSYNVDTAYDPFLSACLARDDFGHLNFAYDWRKPFSASTEDLRQLIHHTYTENGGEPVHLVAHSMGGLMVRATLMEYGDELWDKIGKIVFIATPHYGAPMLAGYLKNHLWGFDLMAVLGLYLSRETYRSMWGVLSLIPAPRGIYPGTRLNDPQPWSSDSADDAYVHPCANFDLHQADAYQLDLTAAENVELQRVLDAAADFHRQMYAAHSKLDQTLRDKMLVIAGVGYQTLFRLAYEPRFWGLWEQTTKTMERQPGNRHRDGDSRVPLASAELENVEIRYVEGVHGGLPNVPAVFNEVFRWLNDESLRLPDTAQGALSGHLGGENTTSETPHLDGSIRAEAGVQDDPGVLNLTMPDSALLQALDAKIESGEVPDFVKIKLL